VLQILNPNATHRFLLALEKLCATHMPITNKTSVLKKHLETDLHIRALAKYQQANAAENRLTAHFSSTIAADATAPNAPQ